MNISNTDIAGMLEDLEKREAFVKTGSTSYAIKTRDTRLFYSPTATDARARHSQIQKQTRDRFCIPRSKLETREPELLRETQDTPKQEQDLSGIDTALPFIPEPPEGASEPPPPLARQEKPASPPHERREKQPKPSARPVKPPAAKRPAPPPEPEREPDDTPWQPYTEL